MIWGVDFDGTLCRKDWPRIGAPNCRLIRFLISVRQRGDEVILITMREGELLEEAVAWCKSYGLEFDAVNDNLKRMQEYFGDNPRKVFANKYIDDNNLSLKHVMKVLEESYGDKEAKEPVSDWAAET